LESSHQNQAIFLSEAETAESGKTYGQLLFALRQPRADFGGGDVVIMDLMFFCEAGNLAYLSQQFYMGDDLLETVPALPIVEPATGAQLETLQYFCSSEEPQDRQRFSSINDALNFAKQAFAAP